MYEAPPPLPNQYHICPACGAEIKRLEEAPCPQCGVLLTVDMPAPLIIGCLLLFLFNMALATMAYLFVAIWSEVFGVICGIGAAIGGMAMVVLLAQRYARVVIKR